MHSGTVNLQTSPLSPEPSDCTIHWCSTRALQSRQTVLIQLFGYFRELYLCVFLWFISLRTIVVCMFTAGRLEISFRISKVSICMMHLLTSIALLNEIYEPSDPCWNDITSNFFFHGNFTRTFEASTAVCSGSYVVTVLLAVYWTTHLFDLLQHLPNIQYLVRDQTHIPIHRQGSAEDRS